MIKDFQEKESLGHRTAKTTASVASGWAGGFAGAAAGNSVGTIVGEMSQSFVMKPLFQNLFISETISM